jgi:hypothetical protein
MEDDECGAGGGMLGRGNGSNRKKTCPSDALSNINSTQLDVSSNPDRCGEKPVTNSLSYGTAFSCKRYSLSVNVFKWRIKLSMQRGSVR